MQRYGVAVAVLVVALLVSVGSAALGSPAARSSQRVASAKHALGIVTFSSSDVLTNRFLDAVKKGMQKKGWSVTSVDANGSTANANSVMKALVQKKVTAILVTVFPPSTLAAGMAATRRAGVPVVD